MAISFDGANKIITLNTDTSFNVSAIYHAAIDWAVLEGNMQYLTPMIADGKADLGGGVYTDIIYILHAGWKLKPSGYIEGDQIKVLGTLITDDNTVRVTPQTVGGCPIWIFQVATYGTIATVSTGSGLSTEEHNALLALPTAPEVRQEIDSNSTKLNTIVGLSAAAVGK